MTNGNVAQFAAEPGRFMTTKMHAVRRGWNDAISGLPPDPNFADHANKEISSAYENGRLVAANVFAAGLNRCLWESGRRVPAHYCNVRDLSFAMVGSPIPAPVFGIRSLDPTTIKEGADGRE